MPGAQVSLFCNFYLGEKVKAFPLNSEQEKDAHTHHLYLTKY